jgi:hypothetical protein
VPAEDKLKAAALSQLAAIDRERSQLLKKERYTQFGGIVLPDDYAEFNALCLAAIDRMTGRRDGRYEQALRELERYSLTSPELAQALYGLVRSMKSDIDCGSLISFREIEHAYLCNTVLELAEWKLDQHHTHAAAVLIGGVLETHLRLLAAKYDIPLAIANPGKAEPRTLPQQINDELAQVVYGKSEREIVAVWLRLTGSPSPNPSRTAICAAQLRGFMARYPA